MTTHEGRQELLMLDPADQARLDTLSVEEIAADAAQRMWRGGVVPAVELYRVVLKRDPRHADALRAIAKATEGEDIDRASALYRRADAVGGLEPDDYLRWSELLLTATPPRSRHAIDAIRRLRVQFPQRPDAIAQAATLLADADELAAAEVIVRDIDDPAGLSQSDIHGIVRVMRKLLDVGGLWRLATRRRNRRFRNWSGKRPT